MGKGTDTSGPGSLRAGALTALSLLVVSGVAAVTGVLIAHEFGRSEQTDGLLAAYGVVIVIVVASQAIRVAVLPPLARAAQEGRLAGELAGYALALLAIAIPLVLAAEIWAGWLGKHLIGHQSPLGQETAAEALKWMVPAGALQLFAGLAASGLAALDDYGTAAVGYGAGSAAGLALIVWRAEPNGIVSVAWGTMLNAAIALAVPACWLTIRAHRSGMPRSAVVPRDRGLRARFGAFGVGVVLPIAQQLLYVVTLPFAARVGPGSATTFVYAYLAAAALVTVTAGSLGLVTTVPLSRADGTVARTARHVVSASWVALVLVGAAAGAFAVAGGDLVQSVLGSSYRGNVGADVGRVFVWLSPWMIASVGVAVTFPLTFVAARTARLPWIALAGLVLQIALAAIGVRILELDGLALALGCSTIVILVALLADLGALAAAARGLAVAALAVTGTCLVAFAPPALLLGSVAAACAGLVLYAFAFALVRPRPLIESWQYLRALR